ncbi:restriction endonuclease subunit S [Kineobactrum salinum]|nr:restriction endonuclease subunit S [Kineobactrum salinum]
MENGTLPSGWSIQRLGDLFDFKGGGTPDKKNPAYWSGDIPWASVKDIKNQYLNSTIDRITEKGLKESAANLAKPGDLVLLTRIEPGKAAIVKIPVAVNQDCKIAKPKECVDLAWAYYMFLANEREFIKRSSGTTVLGIRINDVKEIPVALPPLEEQNRIVAKIETLFSELDKGIESLKTAREQLKVYRQAVLDSAFNKFKSWDAKQVALSDLIGKISQGWSPKCELNRTPNEGEWAIIKTTALQPMKYMSEECKPLPEQFEPRPDIEINVGDFLMTRKGPRNRTGVVCLVRETRERSMLCDTVYRFRCNEEIVRPEYLELVLNSPSVVAELDKRKSGISDSGISLNHGKVKTIVVPIAGSPDQQRLLVESIREKLEYITRVENEIENNLAKSEALRQSILKRAFSGHLAPQNPSDGSAHTACPVLRR